ncbi:hypothetical protein QBC45DRAFT_437130 [Copromyces sp. CBS 386.78]|nr:hypothetical protein QBC45DRAFT_437130 [Copromyces sp. CBS 386.78]
MSYKNEPATDCTKSPMAALASVSNPAAAERYLVFYNDSNNQLACAQGDTLNTSSPLYDYTSAASADVPAGDMANPSSLAAVLFDSMVCVYGVFNGTRAGELLICRLSPGFDVLNLAGSPPLAATGSSSIAACSNGLEKGTLFYLTKDTKQISQVYAITLPGTQATSSRVPIDLMINPTSYLGSAYGTLATQPANSYVAVQAAEDDNIYVFSRHSEVSCPIQQSPGMDNTPIACVFVGKHLVVYFFGPIGTGRQPNAPPLCRAVSDDLKGFVFNHLDEAPTPNSFTQLTAISLPGPENNGAGTVVLSYVQATSNQLVSWEDSLEGFRDGKKL